MAESHELTFTSKTSSQRPRPTFADIGGYRHHEQDVSTLARLGKKQTLKRRFGFIALFGFSCTILATWETALSLFQQPLENGGPANLAFGFPIAWACSMSVYMVIAEMASIAPIAGGQYFWVSVLAPQRSKRFLSYITGWLTTIAWIATVGTGSVIVGTMIQGIAILNYPTYDSKQWQSTLFCWLILVVAVFVNTVLSAILPAIEGLILILHILGFVSVLIPLVYLSPHGSAKSVFLTSLNEGGWPTQGLSYCVGFIGNVATFVGADAAVHMSEEIENAALNVPRAIFSTMILNGSTGYAMVLAVLFCLGDIESVVDSKTGFPFIQAFYNGTGSLGGTTTMTALMIGLLWCAVIGFLATASRMTWSFARDKGIPFHHFISKVEPRTSIPMIAIALVAIVPALITLIYIGSTTAFEIVVSLSVSGLYGSYFIPCALLLWRRTTGQVITSSSIKPNKKNDSESPDSIPLGPLSLADNGDLNDSNNPNTEGEDEVVQPPLVWGPWRIPGILGTINNAFACVYILFVIFWSFWPPETPTTAQNMNYSILMTGAVILFSIVYYYVWGKGQYKGPLIEEEVRNIARSAK